MTPDSYLLICLLAAPVLAWGIAALLVRSRIFLDEPNMRSLHATATPRTGGIAIAAGMLPTAAFMTFFTEPDLAYLVSGWFLVFLISLIDDAFGVHAAVRLLVHLVAATLVVVAIGPTEPVAVAGSILLVAWGTNLFNFMDGMDGLAGSMAAIGGTVLGVSLLLASSEEGFLLLAAAAGATGFLPFNWPRASLFMGDAGSASLGFLFATASINAVSRGDLPAWMPLLTFLPFIADATFTLGWRALRREAIWRAHREHAYQALVLRGWPVSRVLVLEILAMVVCAGSAALLLWHETDGWKVFALYSAAATLAYFGIIATRRK